MFVPENAHCVLTAAVRGLDDGRMSAVSALPTPSDPARELVACDLCGEDDAEPLVTKNSFRVVRCRGCALVYVNPRLRPGALVSLYETDTYQEHQANRVADAEADTRWRREARARLARLERFAPRRGTLLDVGCSTGWFMGVAREAGWRVVGLDVSAGSVESARARGFDVQLATIENAELAPRSVEAITLFDSIEHMPSPMAALRTAHRLLADDGVMMLTTPNVDGLMPRVTYQLLGRTFGVWEHPGPPGHIYHFGRKTLAAALDRAGFTTVHEETEATDLAHTVGALEDALMDVLKRKARRPTDEDARLDVPLPPPPAPTPTSSGRPPGAATRWLRRAVRTAVRTGAWAATAALAGPAPRVSGGDSLLVVARKR